MATDASGEGSRHTEPAISPSGEVARGAVVGRFVVLGRLGAGGMGIVHAAYDPELDRRVALKVLHTGRAGDDVRARLLREAQAAARLAHPNVVSVFEIGVFADRIYLAMELVEGVTLAAWLQGEHTWDQILAMFVQAGRGIAAAHDAGVIHRDFKPDNVLVGRDGRARVVDFGLARAVGGEPTPPDAGTEPRSEGSAIATPLTQTGALLGTPRFMAPEQFTGGAITPAADQFAFCVALYSALYKTPPFRGEHVTQIASHVLDGELQPPRTAPGPARLRRAIVRGLAVAPAERHPSMHALLRELEAALSARRRRWIAAIAGGGVALVVAGTLAASAFARDEAPPACGGVGARADTVWNPERAARVRAAFAARSLPYGDQAAGGVIRRLDRYAAAWSAMRTEACTATHVDGEQSPQLLDLRVACLDERLAELAAFAAALETADADAVRRAIDGADRLSSLAPCADRSALAAAVRPPDPAVAGQVAAVTEKLAHAAVLNRLGKPQPALAEAERACSQLSERVAYAPLVARCRRDVGALVEDARGDHERAVALLNDAVAQAIAGNDVTRATDAATALARVLADGLDRFDDAERWLKLADGAGARLADRADLDADLATVRGIIAARRGKRADALVQAERLLALRERRDPNGLPAANARVFVGHALMALGRVDDAEPQYRRALAIVEEVSGAAHPNLLPVLDGLGQLELARDKPAEAVRHLERSLAITRATVAPGHATLVTALANLGVAYTNAGQLDRALATLDEARATVAAGDRRQLAQVLSNLVVVYQQRHEPQRAFEVAEQALAVERDVKGDDHAETALAYFNLGDTQLALGHARAAAAAMRKAIAIWEHTLPPDHPYLATGRTALADTLLQLADPRGAVSYAERAVAMHDLPGEQLSRARFVLAQALWANGGDRQRSRSLANAAANALPPGDPSRAPIDAWLDAHR